MNATSSHGPWSPSATTGPGGTGPTSLPGPHFRPLGPRLSAGQLNRPPRPFFVREIYKNGFLKRLPYNEKKSSALSKLMKTDRYWVVFSVHDDAIPFLELWTEPSEVASKPPQFMFPLAVCQHISPSLVPAGDHEWTFVVNFETAAIRFSCNSRETMEEWVDCIRNKLGEMGILNPKGNLYTRVGHTPTKTRNPMSPLPQPPQNPVEPPERASTTNNSNQSFTTSIYLNQVTNVPTPTTSAEAVTVSAQTTSSTSVSTVTTPGSANTSSVYLNKSNPTRHVTVIPINKEAEESSAEDCAKSELPSSPKKQEEPYYDAIADIEPPPPKAKVPASLLKKAARQQSPSKQQQDLSRKYSDNNQRIKKKSQRSSSLGPLLDEQPPLGTSMANTNSLESIDSNPRQKLPKGDLLRAHGRIRATGAIPRRPLAISTSQDSTANQQQPPLASSPIHFGSPPRHLELRPPPYMPGPPMPGTHPPHPPHIPLPGLTCQLSLMLPQPQQQITTAGNELHLREQQVYRLRQEIAHPAGVRLTLRKRDCQNSLALVEIFGCLWVAGWKQRDFPILFNAFHVGDQILSVAGQPVRTSSDFNKLVKSKPSSGSGGQPEVLHVEIIVRRLPFAQVYHLKRDVDGQPLGLVLCGNTPEVREIVPGSPAGIHGMTARVRSLDGQALVAWNITEVNGRPLNLLAKDGEATSRLQALGRDVSVLIQPSDFVAKLKKQLKAHKNYKDYLLC